MLSPVNRAGFEPGMIADMAEHLRQGIDVPPGKLLAAIDWMTFRLKESAAAMRVVEGK